MPALRPRLFAAVLALTLAFASSARPDDAKPSYPNSPDGLRSLLQDLFAAEKSGDAAKAAALYSSLALPADSTWFSQTFVAAEATRLSSQYAATSAAALAQLKKSVADALANNRTDFLILPFAKPDDTPLPLAKAVLSAMVVPQPLYEAATITAPGDKSPFFLGFFVYVDGAFRFMDPQVFSALSTAPPPRLRAGGEVMKKKLISSPQPGYPPQASMARISGTVRLQVVIGTDGSVVGVKVISGHPLLVPEAVDAVKRWKYQPTLLNGQPVEIDTEVFVIFDSKDTR